MSVIQPFFKDLQMSSFSSKKRISSAGGCSDCRLYKNCQSPKMSATGEGKRGIFVLAEAPGALEDKQGIQLVGRSGQRLRQELAKIGIDLDRDCRKMNAVNCRPDKNRTPTDIEIACCRHRVLQEIKDFNPVVILALGNPAMKSLCQHRSSWDAGFPTMTQWQGEVIPDQDLQAWIIPTWHPAFLERLNGHPVYESRWRQSLCQVGEKAVARPEKNNYEDMLEIFMNPVLAVVHLQAIYEELCSKQDSFISFDYETTGLKPYTDGHKILCCSMAWREDRCISFSATEQTWPYIYKILCNPKIGKAAHNIKFEHLWTRIRGWPEHGGFAVRNWAWDSMLAAHILDNRTGRAGLKFQSYIKFGVIGYDETAAPYIRSNKKNSNSMNRALDLPMQDLLKYCGMDSLLEYRLAKHQMRTAEKLNLLPACQFFREGAIALVDAEINGIRVDTEYCHKQKNHLERKIMYLKSRMNKYEEVRKWQNMAGSKFSLNSGPQLARLLYDELKLEVSKQTASGAASVDKNVLEDLDLPFIQDLLQIRKLEKIRGTYLRAYIEEAPDGILHPFYHLHKVVSFRGSCSDPNFQNIPKRDSIAQKTVRRALLPKPGMCWFEVDYSGIEVRIAATYHKDPNMLSYLSNPHSDMHRDTAMDICLLEEEQVSKYLRQAAKNGFVFAQFYGDWYKACASNIWHKWFNSPDALLADGKTHIKKWLASKGIKDLDRFTKHIQKVEDKFWLDRFPVYNQWREDHWNEYLKKGYFWGHTGFKYSSIMERNDAINYGTQGAAFHCLLWAFTKVTNTLKNGKWRSVLIGQIHDAMDGCAAPEEINNLVPMIRSIMIDDLCEHFKWINVPIDVEFEMAPIDKSWYEVKPITKRPSPCECGLEWGYRKKQTDGAAIWTCPICNCHKIEE